MNTAISVYYSAHDLHFRIAIPLPDGGVEINQYDDLTRCAQACAEAKTQYCNADANPFRVSFNAPHDLEFSPQKGCVVKCVDLCEGYRKHFLDCLNEALE